MTIDPGTHEHWETLARFHGTTGDSYYDLDKVVAGGTLMTELEEQALARATWAPPEAPLSRLAGVDVVHLHSHIGADSVVLARAGARVTAVDFSGTALARARELAERLGVTLETVQADSQTLPSSLAGRFDVAYATIGVLCWIGDLDAWMTNAARCLRPGGLLVLMELHPLLSMVAQADPPIIDFPYAFEGPKRYSGTGSYAAPDDTSLVWDIVEYGHSLGEIVTAAITAGLVVTRLEEHTELAFDPRGGKVVTRESDGRYRLRIGSGGTSSGGIGSDGASSNSANLLAEPLPLAFTLLARKS